jgi:predicted amidohydrolase
MKVTMVQRAPALLNKEENLKTIEKEVLKAGKKGSDLVMFGELFLTGYRIKDRVSQLAETSSGLSIKRIAKVAKCSGCHVLFGMPEKDQRVRGLIYNSAVLVSPKGKVDVYRKWFLPNFGPFEEKIHYTPGKGLRVFDTDIGRIGVFICYDIFFPELAKAYALMGAELLAVISAAPSSSRFFFEHLAQARAIENAMPLAYCNLVGVEEGLKFFGGSVLVGARGGILAKAKVYEEEVLTGEVDPAEVDFARFHRPTVRDTRPEIFKILERELGP